jgi:hypothetical protein
MTRRRRGLGSAMAVLGFLFGVAPIAHSASRDDWKRRPPGRFHVGPFWLTPKIELRNAGVDTNVYNQLANPVADNSVVIRPGMRAAMAVGRRVRLEGGGYLDLNYFRGQRTERSTDFGGDGRGELDFGPFTFFGGGGGLQARQRASIDLDERVRRQEQSQFGGFDLRMGRGIMLTGRANFGTVRHAPSRQTGAELQRALDRDTRTASGELRYRMTALTTLVGTAQAIEDTFVHQRDLGRITRSFRYMGGFEFGERALLSGSVMAGIRHFPGSTAGSVPEYAGPALRIETTMPVGSMARLSLLADRDVYYAVTALRTQDDRLRNTYVSKRLESGLALSLPFKFLARGTAGFQSADYLIPYVVQGANARRVDHLYTGTASLLRAVGDSFRVGATVAWQRRVSNLVSFSYGGLRYGLQAELVP